MVVQTLRLAPAPPPAMALEPAQRVETAAASGACDPSPCSAAARAELPMAAGNDEEERAPQRGERIMVLQWQWLVHVLSGKKTVEVRNKKIRPGHVWLGHGGKIYGHVNITNSFEMTVEEFRKSSDAHLWPEDQKPPYNRLCGLTLGEPRALQEPLAYWRPNGAIGWNRFYASEEDMSPRRKRPKEEVKEQGQRKRKGA